MSIFVVFHYFFIFESPRLLKNSLRLGSSTKKFTFRHLIYVCRAGHFPVSVFCYEND